MREARDTDMALDDLHAILKVSVNAPLETAQNATHIEC
jgi:hypothetical protein